MMKTIDKFAAMVFVLGRMAYLKGTCIFDCPYDATDPKTDHWMDGYIFEEKKYYDNWLK